MLTLKTCRACLRELLPEQFRRDARQPDGRMARCRSCMRYGVTIDGGLVARLAGDMVKRMALARAANGGKDPVSPLLP